MKRLPLVISFLIVPTLFILLSCSYLSCRHKHTQAAQFAGYYINYYYDTNGDKFYELTSKRDLQGHQCSRDLQTVVLDKVYAFIIRDNTLYVRSNGGDAAINADGFCRLLPRENSAYARGDDIYIMPSLDGFFPRDYQTLSLMTHHYNAYSTHNRDVVSIFGNGRFRIESVLDQNGEPSLCLVDALQLQSRSGHAIRLLSHVTSYESTSETLVVFAKEGKAVFHNTGNKYAVMYYNSGVYKHLLLASDIKALRYEREFTISDRALFHSVAKSAVS